MSSNVYFIPVDNSNINNLSNISKTIFETIIEKENIQLKKEVPIKVHFGESGNISFVPALAYDGIIDYLKEHNVQTRFIETNVMYKGRRTKRNDHINLAKEHKFTRIPITIADGIQGEDYYEVEINKIQLKSCKVGKAYSNYDQIIVCAHFKGHMLAGFGGAIKQLSMGFASRGGKLVMHLDAKPFIISFLCKSCGACIRTCPVEAITLEKKAHINKEICVGCAACTTICPHNAIKLNMLKILSKGLGSTFIKKLVEYAYAAQLNKQFIYINYAINITKGCDCEGHSMKPLIDDLGVFASTDPVAIDQACYDLVKQNKKEFKGKVQLTYGSEIGLGTTEYNLIIINK